jgi:hypothetical protein
LALQLIPPKLCICHAALPFVVCSLLERSVWFARLRLISDRT